MSLDSLAKRLTAFREKSQLSKRELARKANVSPEYLSSLESGAQTNVGTEKVEGIANALGVDPAILAFGKPEAAHNALSRVVPVADRDLKQIMKVWDQLTKAQKTVVRHVATELATTYEGDKYPPDAIPIDEPPGSKTASKKPGKKRVAASRQKKRA